MIQPTAGTKLAIGTTASDATADSYTTIGSLNQLPEFGDEYGDISFEDVGEAEHVHNTGAKDSPSFNVGIGRDMSDSGQTAVIVANGVNSYYNFRVTYPDASVDYFKAKVQAYKTTPGGLTANVMAAIKLQPKPGSYDYANAGSAPANSVLPAISGTAQEDETLTAWVGTWTNSPTSYTYQWKLDGSNIVGATNATYTCVTGDVDGAITVAVTAVNAAGSASATSAATATVIAA